MPLTTPQARDEMLTLFYRDWRARAPFVVGYEPGVVWDMEENLDADSPRSDRFWARASVQHAQSEQRTFGERGNRRYQHQGTLFVQVFGPRSIDQSASQVEALALIARDAFQSASPGGVWFRRASVQEVNQPSEPWFQMNVSVEFLYDERPPASDLDPAALWIAYEYGGDVLINEFADPVQEAVNEDWPSASQLA